MVNQAEVKIGIGYTIDKTGLSEVIKSLKQIQDEAKNASKAGGLSSELKNAASAAKQLENILNEAWNNKLGQLDLSRLNNSIKESYGSVANLKATMEASGASGATAYNKVASSILNTNLQLKQGSKLLNDMATSMANTVKWGIASSVFNNITGSIQRAYYYTLDLDKSLNDIRIVTSKSADDMDRFAVRANNAAKALGQSTTAYTNASLIYYQQGLSDEDVAARAETTLKAANVTGQNAQQVSEQLTAVWNGYKVSAEEAELYVDKLAAVAATTASDLEELSVGMSRVASAANLMGVDVDQLNAQLATIISVTRQAPESVGVALRSVYARMSDIQAGLDTETTLDNYTKQMAQMGVNVLDANNKLRDMGDVIEEVGDKWNTMSREQQVFLAQAMAGTRQYNNLLALFDNWDAYNEALETSSNAMGTLQDQQDIYMESTEAHLQQLKTEAEETYGILFNANTVNDFTSALTGALGVFNNFLQGIGGGGASFLYFGSLVAKVFNNQIGSAIERQIQNIQAFNANRDALKAKTDIINAHAARGEDIGLEGNAVMIESEYAEKLLAVRQSLSSEEYNSLTNQQMKIGLLENELQTLMEEQGYVFAIREENQSMAEFDAERLQYVQEDLDAQEKKVNIIAKQKQSIEAAVKLYQDGLNLGFRTNEMEEERAKLINSIHKILQENNKNSELNLLTTKEKIALDAQLRGLRSGEAVDTKVLANIVESINQKYNGQVTTLTQLKQILDGITLSSKQRAALEEDILQKERQEAISKTVNGLTSLTMLLQSGIGIIRTLGDETLSTGEKIERVTSTLLISLPIVISNLKAVKDLMPALTTLTTGTSTAAGGTAAIGEMAGGVGASGLATFAAAAAAVVAVLGAIGVGAYLAVKAYNADSDAAKKAAAAAKEVKDSYDEIKNSYDELKDSLSQYQEARDGLDTLIKGTDEWKEKLNEVNNQVLELLNTYPQLASYIQSDNGMLEISQAGQDALLKAQSEKVATMYRASLLSSMTSNDAQNRSDITDFVRKNKYFIPGMVDETYTGTEISRESMNRVLDAIDKNGTSILENSQTLMESADISQLEADALLKNTGELISLSESVKANTESNKILGESIGTSLLEDTQYANAEFSNQLASALGDKIEEINKETSNRYADQGKFSGGKTDKQIQEAYAEAMGYERSKNKGDNMGSYLKDGEWIQISDEVARAYLAAQEAQDQAKNSIKDYAEAFKSIGKVAGDSENVKTALFNVASGIDDIGSLTQQEAENLGQLDVSSLQSELELLGTTPEELQDKLSTISDSWQEASDNIAKDMALSVQDAFDELDKSELSLNDQEFVAAALARASAMGKLDEAIDAYNSGSLEGLEEFDNTLSDTTQNAAAAASNFTELSKTLSKLKSGDTISAEDYAKLGEAGQSYFVQMLDGTYKLTRSAEDLKKTVQEDFIGTLRDQVNILRTQNSNIQAVQGYDFDTLATNRMYTGEDGKGHYNTKEVQQQIDLIVALGDQSEETALKIDKWRQELETGFMDPDDLQEIADMVGGLGDAFANSSELIDANNNSALAWERTLLSSYDTIDELEQHLGDVSLEAFNERLKELQNTLDEDIDPEALSDLRDVIQDVADSSEGIGTELADSLKEDEEAAEDVAEAILRFDDACKEVADNYEDWLSALQSGDLQDQAEIIDDLRDSYADLLDMNGSSLSDEFLQSADNLELMHKAIDGDIEAYDELLSRAGQDILVKCGIDTTQFAEDVAWLNNQIINGENFNDIEIGANLDDTGFLNGLSNMVNAAGMSAAQATDYLASMGVDAEVEEVNTTANETHEYMGAIAHTTTESVDSVDPLTGTPVTYNIPSITYEPAPMEATATKENTAFSLKVTSAKKSSGGGFKFSQAKNGGGSAGKARRSKGKSGGGGGGGGKEPAVEKYVEKQADRYHDINQQVEKLDKSLERVQRDQEKLAGEDLLDNLNEQLDILEKQKAVYENKIRLEKEEAAELRSALAAEGATFDSEGYLTNYTAVLQAKLDYVNNLIDQYNAMSAEEQEKFKDTIEQAQKDYDELEKNIERYDTIKTEIFDLEDQIEDAVDRQIEINIKKFTAEVEIRLDMAETERDFNEFRRKVLNGIKDDDIIGNAKADLDDYFSYLETYDTGIGPIEALTDQVNKTMDEVYAIADDGYSEIYGKNSQKALEDLQNYSTELMKQLEDMEELADEIRESYLDMIDQAIDEFDDHVDQFEYINDLLNHDMNLVGLLYGDDAYADMNRYYRQIQTNNNEELKFLRERVNYANEMMKLETDPEARKKWIEEWQDSLEELNDKVEESVENIIDKYSNLIEQIFDKLNDKVTGGLGLDYVGEEWDLINKNSERYLDNINKMQALQELENKYLEGIANTDDLVAQQKLKDVMDQQLAYLREKDKLTEYDVERANMMYELTLKQLALENAQQTKTNLRLRRDSQGNYTYQYVSDEDELEQKRQELLQAQNDLYNFDKNQYVQNLDDLYSMYEEFQDKVKELYLDPTLDPEERLKKQQLLTEQYGELIIGIITENEYIRSNLYDSAFNDLALLYDTDVQNFKDMSQQEQDELMNSLIPQWDSGVEHMAEKIAGEGGLVPVCSEAFSELGETTQEYQNDLSDVEDAADVTFEALHDGLSEGVTDTRALIEENDNLISKYRDELIPEIKNVINILGEMEDEYDRVKTAAEDAAAAAYELAQAQQSINADADWDDGYEPSANSNIGANVLQNRSNSSSSSSSSSSSGSSSSGGSSSTKTRSPSSSSYLFKGASGKTYNKGDTQWIHPNYVYSTPSAINALPVKDFPPGNAKIVSYYKGKEYPVRVSLNGRSGYVALSHFDTGGYTGEWAGGGGKAAILHEKELVLNQEDTKNILSAVNIVRHMDELVNNLNTATSIHTSSLLGGLGRITNNNYPNNNNAVDQNVHITAEFPGVRDSKEIEDALNNLVNAASMHAFNNRR